MYDLTAMFYRTCNLATQCLRSEFSQQIRAHEFIPKITSSLSDLLEHPVRGGEGGGEGRGRQLEQEGGEGEGRERERVPANVS